MGATAGLLMSRPYSLLADTAPAGRVAVATCREYGPGVGAAMSTMFDQLGGLDRLVRGKTVAIKLNLTGVSYDRLDHVRQGDSYWVHPNVVGATIRLMAKAGARRVRLPLQLARLTTYRPATVDLVLTKMARGDEQDLEDIGFLLSQEPIAPRELQAAFARARVPEVTEIRQLFIAAQPKVLKLASDQLK